MANTVNAALIQTANTLNQWRIRDNLIANDVNEIARGDFVKPTGNVTVSDGYVLLNKGTGTTLTVASSARVAGTLSVNSIEADQSGHVYMPGNVVASNRATNATFQVNTNVAIDSVYTLFSNTNPASVLQINVANVIITGNLTAGGINIGGGGTSTGLGNNIILQSYREHKISASGSGTYTVDASKSNWFVYTMSGNTTFTFENVATSNVHTISLVLIQGGSAGYSPSWGNTIKWAGGTTPPPTKNSVGNTDIWSFMTFNGGTSYVGSLIVKDV